MAKRSPTPQPIEAADQPKSDPSGDEVPSAGAPIGGEPTPPPPPEWPKSVTILREATINSTRYLAGHPAVVTQDEFTTLRALGAI